MTIPEPKRTRSDPDRFDECQRAVEDRLLEVLGMPRWPDGQGRGPGCND